MTSTKTLFNGVVDAVITRINTNKVVLGVGGVEERAEDPAVMDKVRQYGGYCYVIPLAEGRDRMDVMQGGTKDMYHNFSFNVTSYFDSTAVILAADSLVTSLRATRNLAFDLIDNYDVHQWLLETQIQKFLSLLKLVYVHPFHQHKMLFYHLRTFLKLSYHHYK